MSAVSHTQGPWEYVPGNEHHGPYVTSEFGSTICDLYAMSNPSNPSVRNGGDSRPIPFLSEMAEPNARLIAASPELFDGCNALIGLIQLVCSRDDMPAGIRDALESSHRLDEARAAVAKAGGQ